MPTSGWRARGSPGRTAPSAPLRARWTVLATGAASGPLTAAGVCERRPPSGIALRGYVRNDAMAERVTGLDVVWHRALRRGYGWIFPCTGGVFNIGVGITHGRADARDVNLRELFDAFTRLHRAGARADGARPVARTAEGRAAALLARRRALVAARICWWPARRRAAPISSPAKASARRWRPACSPRRPLPRRRDRRWATREVRARYEAALARAEAALRGLRAGQSHQRPSVAGRPRDLARAAQRKRQEPSERGDGGNAQPGHPRDDRGRPAASWSMGLKTSADGVRQRFMKRAISSSLIGVRFSPNASRNRVTWVCAHIALNAVPPW